MNIQQTTFKTSSKKSGIFFGNTKSGSLRDERNMVSTFVSIPGYQVSE